MPYSIVAMGTSWGGLVAMSKLLGELPAITNLPRLIPIFLVSPKCLLNKSLFCKPDEPFGVIGRQLLGITNDLAQAPYKVPL